MQKPGVPPDEPGAGSPERPLVLVVDDDQAIRTLFSLALERAGFAVLAASDGRAAVALVRDHNIRVVVLDLHMPGTDGVQTLRELRADTRTAGVPVIVATGSADETDRLAVLNRGADDVIVKPVSIEELVARVQAQVRASAVAGEETGPTPKDAPD